MTYDPKDVIAAYERNAQIEDASEKKRSLRVELPRAFIRKYLQPSDVALDAGGGVGINAIVMAKICQKVTLLDITPAILTLAARNIDDAGLSKRIESVEGDITDLNQFGDGSFSFVVCVGDSVSYVLDGRFKAIAELVRVARPGSILIIGCDSKLGFMRMKLAQGMLDEALEIQETSTTTCGMGPRTHLYTVEEMTGLLEGQGCEVLEVASTPTFADTIDTSQYVEDRQWAKLKALELEMCTRPELLGMGLHLLFVARKRG
jgi:ubiquinone/menaquinone biosynthesis C-methylase UbiE